MQEAYDTDLETLADGFAAFSQGEINEPKLLEIASHRLNLKMAAIMFAGLDFILEELQRQT